MNNIKIAKPGEVIYIAGKINGLINYKEVFKAAEQELIFYSILASILLLPSYLIGSISNNKHIVFICFIICLIGFLFFLYATWLILKPDIKKFIKKVIDNM